MELKDGYKKTEIGLIPDDWEVKSVIDIAPLQRGFDLPNKNLQKGIYPVVYSNGIVNYHNKSQAKAPGIVTGRSGTIGKVTFVERDYWPHNTALWVTDFRNNIPKYIYYLYLAIKLERFATGSGVPTLNRNDVHNFKIAIPKSKEEQKAIAEVLSDTDNLIQALEKRIAKKCLIKQGAMQKLLSPKEDWEVKALGEVADIIGGGTPNTFMNIYWNGTINWFTPTEIGLNKYTFESIRKISTEGLKNSSAKILPIGTVLLTSRAGIGDLSILKVEGCTNQGFQSLIPKESINNEFLYYLMITLKNVLIQNASGSTFLEISPNRIKQIEVSLPDYKEQTHIATILSDMDKEIETLEKKLVKYKLIKQGLMQNLLTGKIRLV